MTAALPAPAATARGPAQGDDIAGMMEAMGRAARAAATALASTTAAARNRALSTAAAALRQRQGALLEANRRDLAAARSAGLAAPLMERLALDAARIEAMAQGLDEIAALADPLGREQARWQMPNGLDIARIQVPLGVVGVLVGRAIEHLQL